MKKNIEILKKVYLALETKNSFAYMEAMDIDLWKLFYIDFWGAPWYANITINDFKTGILFFIEYLKSENK